MTRRQDGRYALERLTESDRTLGHWSSVSDGCNRTIYHYQTRMLEFDIDTKTVIYWSTGHGSVSDQSGMNRLFRALGSRLYFSRKYGARIE